MKYLCLPALLCLLLSAQSTFAQTEAFSLSSNFPKTGQKVTLSYRPETVLLKTKSPIIIVHFIGVKDYKKVAYAWDNEYKAEQVYTLKPNGKAWTCEFTIPDKTRIFYVTMQPDKYVVGSAGVVYRQMVYKNRKPLSGAYILTAYNRSSPPDTPISTVDDLHFENIMDAYQKEYELYPDSPFELHYYGVGGSANREVLLKKIAEFKKSDIEKVMMMASGVLRAMWQVKEPDANKPKLPKGMTIADDYAYPYRKQADSLDEVIKAKFPHGITMKAALTKNYFKAPTFEQRELLLAKLLKQCPQDVLNTQTMLRLESAIYYLQDFDMLNYQKQFRLLKNDDESLAYNANEIIYHWALKGEHLPEAEMVAHQVLAIATRNINKPANKPYRAGYLSSYNTYRDTYAYILFKRGKLTEAIKQQSAVYKESKGEFAEKNEHYVQMLNAAGQYKLALQVAQQSIDQQKSTPKLYEEFKWAYDKVNGTNDGLSTDSVKIIKQ